MADTPPADTPKKLFRSKTFWVQLITLIAALFPEVQTFIQENPVRFTSGLVAVNLLVRFFTSGRIELFSSDGKDDDSAGSGWSPLLLICMAAACALVGGLLSSCTLPGDYDLTGRAFIGGADAKAGLKFEGGNVIPFGRVALHDPETGRLTGHADLQAVPRVHATK